MSSEDNTAAALEYLVRKRLEEEKNAKYAGIKVVKGVQTPSLMELTRMADELEEAAGKE